MKKHVPDRSWLSNKRVLVASSPQKSLQIVTGLAPLAGSIISFPVMKFHEVAEKQPLDHSVFHLNEYSWVIFTSINSAKFFLSHMDNLGIPLNVLGERSICAVGPATALYLEEAGIPVSLLPKEFVAEGIVEGLKERLGGHEGLSGLRILIPRAKKARDILPHDLTASGADVDVVPCYENVLPNVEEELIRSVIENPPDLIVFTSSSAVRNFATIIGKEEAIKIMSNSTLAVLGKITAGTIQEFGMRADILPEESTIPSMLTAIREHR